MVLVKWDFSVLHTLAFTWSQLKIKQRINEVDMEIIAGGSPAESPLNVATLVR